MLRDVVPFHFDSWLLTPCCTSPMRAPSVSHGSGTDCIEGLVNSRTTSIAKGLSSDENSLGRRTRRRKRGPRRCAEAPR